MIFFTPSKNYLKPHYSNAKTICFLFYQQIEIITIIELFSQIVLIALEDRLQLDLTYKKRRCDKNLVTPSFTENIGTIIYLQFFLQLLFQLVLLQPFLFQLVQLLDQRRL